MVQPATAPGATPHAEDGPATGPEMTPLLSIIIPANDEESHIAPCLEALLAQEGVAPSVLEVVVAANGCADATVPIARALEARFARRGWRLTVLDIPEGGKAGALNRGDAVARSQACAYLDADVTLDAGLLALTLEAMARPDPVYVTGRLNVARARSWISRRYGELFMRLPFMRPGAAPGAGFFAVNAAGRARWGDFPAVIADDTYVRWLFTPVERIEVAAGYSWPLVEGFAALVRVRRRQDAGGRQLRRLYPQLEANEGKPPVRKIDHLRLFATGPTSYLIYIAIMVAVRMGGRDGETWSRGGR
jgi:glycosyltransferase involved in cell wall biosynthesis